MTRSGTWWMKTGGLPEGETVPTGASPREILGGRGPREAVMAMIANAEGRVAGPHRARAVRALVLVGQAQGLAGRRLAQVGRPLDPAGRDLAPPVQLRGLAGPLGVATGPARGQQATGGLRRMAGPIPGSRGVSPRSRGGIPPSCSGSSWPSSWSMPSRRPSL